MALLWNDLVTGFADLYFAEEGAIHGDRVSECKLDVRPDFDIHGRLIFRVPAR